MGQITREAAHGANDFMDGFFMPKFCLLNMFEYIFENNRVLLTQTIPVKISPEDIEIFEPGKSLDIYVNVIGIKPGFTKEEKRSYGSRFVSGLIEVIVTLGEKGVFIDAIAARSNMPDGIRLMKGIGFAEIEPLTPERRTFVIKIKELV